MAMECTPEEATAVTDRLLAEHTRRELLAAITCGHCGSHDVNLSWEITYGMHVRDGELVRGPLPRGDNGLPYYVTCNACDGEVELDAHANDSFDDDMLHRETLRALDALIPEGLRNGEW